MSAKVASTKKVAKKTAAKASTHPPVASMVKAAIGELKEKKGSSLAAIKKYILANYKGVDMTRTAPFIRRYLKKAVAEGIISQNKGSFLAGSEAKPKKATVAGKKSSTKKVAVVKKSTAKKPTKAGKKASGKESKVVKKTAAKQAPVAKKSIKRPLTKSPKKSVKKPVAKKMTKKPVAKKSASAKK